MSKKSTPKKSASETRDEVLQKHMDKRFTRMREEKRLPPKVQDELETKLHDLSLTKKQFDSICDNVIESYERALV